MDRDAWSDRHERQFEQVKRSELARGKPEALAEDIARRVVELRRQFEVGTDPESSGPHSARL